MWYIIYMITVGSPPDLLLDHQFTNEIDCIIYSYATEPLNPSYVEATYCDLQAPANYYGEEYDDD